MPTYEHVRELAFELPPEERAALQQELLDSLHKKLDPQVEQYWRDEIERRIDEEERGEVELYDGEEVLAELRQRLHERAQ